MICPKCGKESNTRFCTFCGAPMFQADKPPVPLNDPEPSKKAGNKTMLWIFLGVLAALVLAGGLFLFLALRNRPSGTVKKEPHLYIFTRDGEIYVDDADHMMASKSDSQMLSQSREAGLLFVKDRLYYVKDGEETLVGRSVEDVLDVDNERLKWIIYREEGGNTCMFISDLQEEIVLTQGGKEIMGWGYGSPNGRYYAYLCYTGKDYSSYSLRRVNLSGGEIENVYGDSDDLTVYGVDDKGCVYFRNNERVYVFSNGVDEIKGVHGLILFKDFLLCSGWDDETFFTRPLGKEGELEALTGEFDSRILKSFGDDPYSYGLTSGSGYSRSLHHSKYMILEDDGDLVFLDLKAKKTELLLEDATLRDLSHVTFIEEKKTMYVAKGSSLYKLTRGRDGWKRERISKKLDYVSGVYRNGVVFVENSRVCIYDGKEVFSVTGSEDAFAVSEDLQMVAYASGYRIMVKSRDGETVKQIASDWEGGSFAIFKDCVYYVNDDNELVRVNIQGEESEAELVLKDVLSFFHDFD